MKLCMTCNRPEAGESQWRAECGWDGYPSVDREAYCWDTEECQHRQQVVDKHTEYVKSLEHLRDETNALLIECANLSYDEFLGRLEELVKAAK
jgi:hypothetical protein